MEWLLVFGALIVGIIIGAIGALIWYLKGVADSIGHWL